MNILVAGGAGYIGSVLVPRMLARGHSVEVVDRLWFGNQLPTQVRVIEKDLLQLTAAELDGFDQVIFLAGLSNDPMAEYSPSRNFIENGAGAAYLAYIAKRAGVRRFIYGSSCSVYGHSDDVALTEGSPTTSSFAYGISKLQGEFAALQLQGAGFSVISLRQGTVSGYSPRMRLDLIVNSMFRTAVEYGTITVNNPMIWRPILAIQDAATAFISAVESPGSLSGIFNVASGNYSVGEIAELARRELLREAGLDVRVVTNHIAEFRNYRVSTQKAREQLQFTPAFDVGAIIRELHDHCASFMPFDQDRFFNIRIFERLYPQSS